jgi:hypothetical protein
MIYHLSELYVLWLVVIPTISWGSGATSSNRWSKCRCILILTDWTNFPDLRLNRTKSFKLNTVRDRLPFEVKHWVEGWDFYPPISSLECFSNETRIVAWYNYEFIAIFDISISKRNLWPLLYLIL